MQKRGAQLPEAFSKVWMPTVLCPAHPCVLTALNTHSCPFARQEKWSLRRRRLAVHCAVPTDTGTGGGGCRGHLHIHPGGVEGAVPVHREELHPADLLLLLGFLEVRLQHAQGNAPEVVHWKRA